MSADPISLHAPAKQFLVELDGRLRSLATRRAGMDYEIGEALVLAEDARLASNLGFGSLSGYAERVFGFNPHATAERLRVGRILRAFPETAAALREGRLNFSKVREITRILTADNESAWLAAAAAMTAREVEQKVAVLLPGGFPTDRGDPGRRRYIIRLDLKAVDFARYRQLIDALRGDADLPKSDEEIVLEALEAFDPSGERDDGGRSPSQTFFTRCNDCERTFVESRGQWIEVDAVTAERAACDTQQVGDTDKGIGPQRARQTIPPAIRRQVRRRSGGRCEIPGCRSRRGLEIHHIELVSEGGSHDPGNLADLCRPHHDQFHEGLIRIEGGRESGLRFLHADGTPIGLAPDPARLLVAKEVYDALRRMDYSDSEARRAIRSVRGRDGELSVEEFMQAALGELRAMRGDGSGTVSEPEIRYGRRARIASHVGRRRPGPVRSASHVGRGGSGFRRRWPGAAPPALRST